MAYRKLALALDALGDPTRRRILERIAEQPRPVAALAEDLPVTRSAVSQHLRVLKDAGLVTETVLGAQRIYRVDPRGIGAVRDWLETQWGNSLAEFKSFADSTTKKGNS